MTFIFFYRLNAQPTNVPEPTPIQQLTEVIKCPKCSEALALKYVNNSYVLSCFGYPECKHSIWLSNNLLKEVAATDTVCHKCGQGYKKLKFTLKSVRHAVSLNQILIADDGVTYISCIACDTALQELLDISKDSVMKNTISISSNSNRGNQNQVSVPRQPLAPRQIQPHSQPIQNRQPVPNRAPSWQQPPLIRQPAPTHRGQAPPSPPRGDGSNDVKCSACHKSARKYVFELHF